MMITQTDRFHISWSAAVREARTWDGDHSEIISDAAARTIAGAFCSPRDFGLTNIAQGSAFDVHVAMDDVLREGRRMMSDDSTEAEDMVALDALGAWLDNLAVTG